MRIVQGLGPFWVNVPQTMAGGPGGLGCRVDGLGVRALSPAFSLHASAADRRNSFSGLLSIVSSMPYISLNSLYKRKTLKPRNPD